MEFHNQFYRGVQNFKKYHLVYSNVTNEMKFNKNASTANMIIADIDFTYLQPD